MTPANGSLGVRQLWLQAYQLHSRLEVGTSVLGELLYYDEIKSARRMHDSNF